MGSEKEEGSENQVLLILVSQNEPERPILLPDEEHAADLFGGERRFDKPAPVEVGNEFTKVLGVICESRVHEPGTTQGVWQRSSVGAVSP